LQKFDLLLLHLFYRIIRWFTL